MVNGKQNLTFTGAAPVSGARARQRSYVGGHNADNFASYLPLAELGKQSGALPGAQTAQAGQLNSALGPAGIPTRRFVPQQATPENRQAAIPQGAPAQNIARTHLGFLPDNYLSGAAANAAQAGDASWAAADGQTRSQARAQAQPGAQGLAFQNAGVQSQRVPKAAPRISGTPITGRGNIGMVDTRKTAGRNAENTGIPVFGPQNLPAAKSADVQAMPQAGATPANSAYNRYTTLFSNLGGLQSPQSFVSHGFAGSNAALALKKLGYDVNENRSINTYARKLEPDPYDLKDRSAAPNADAVARTSRQEARAAFQAANRTAGEPLPAGNYPRSSLVPGLYNAANQGLGSLAAKFESGAEGIAAIGYDRKGGTSYGKYQIASRVGTMDSFISYLQDKAPDLAGRLNAAGPANTGGRNGKMPDEWRKIAAEEPQRFEQLQSDFIRSSHFEPAMQGIAESTGLAFESMPVALQEVLFSTAVQHGPTGATRIVSQAVQRVGANKLQAGNGKKSAASKKAEEQLITQIYNLRAGQFVSSTTQVQSAVRNRMKQEMREAIEMLA